MHSRVLECTALYSNASLPLGQIPSSLWGLNFLICHLVLLYSVGEMSPESHEYGTWQGSWVMYSIYEGYSTSSILHPPSHPHGHLLLQSETTSLHGGKGSKQVLMRQSFYLAVTSLPPAIHRECQCAPPIEQTSALIWGKKSKMGSTVP